MSHATPDRRSYALALAAMIGIAVYGSLVPFGYRAIPIREAIGQFAQIAFLRLDIYSRADFVANVLLFVPLGFLAMAALRTDREGGAVGTAVLVTAAATVLSVTIEFVQLAFPPRTVSMNDVIAEAAGAAGGTAMWMVCGAWITARLRALFTARDRAGFLVRFLALYAVVFAVSQVLPLDLTISPGELAAKYREGRVVVMPFSHHYESPRDALFDIGADVALHLPLGILAMVAGVRRGERRGWPQAMALGLGGVAAIEAAQLFVFTRVADTTDILVGGTGLAIGVCLATFGWRRSEPMRSTGGLRWIFAAATIVCAAALAGYHWYPFDFVITSELLHERLPLLQAAPFSHYYWGSEFHAFTEVARKLLMGAMLGALADRALSHGCRARTCAWTKYVVFVCCLVFFAGIEAGQLFLVERIPDITDVAIGTLGSVAGMAAVRRALSLAPVVSEEQYV
jgi:VanZ family protein